MRLFYVLLIYLLAPVVIAMEAWKALWNPEYRGRLGQRLGFSGPEPPEPCLWVHGVSVGEVQAAAALIQSLRQLFPGVPVVVTTVMPTGAQRARARKARPASTEAAGISMSNFTLPVTRTRPGAAPMMRNRSASAAVCAPIRMPCDSVLRNSDAMRR